MTGAGPGHVPATALAVCLVLLVVVAATPAAAITGGAAAGAGPSSDATETNDDDRPELRFGYAFERLPDRPGEVRVTVRTAVPDGVTTVGVEPPANATVVDTDGYEPTTREGEREWVWNRTAATSRPTLTYTVGVNRTGDGRLEAVDTGDWALFNWRQVDPSWRYTRGADAPEPAVTERGVAAGKGVVGPGYAYLGPHGTTTRSVDGEEIRLVVPAAARDGMRASPSAVADSLATAADDLRVGARNERLTVFVAPDPIAASGRLSRAGDARQDMYVAADEPLATADSTWLHEYAHSRQSYESGPDMAWFDDASAEYYAALLAHEQGLVAERAFYDHVRTDAYADTTLARTESAADRAPYEKGMRVLAAADARIRADSDGERTLAAVFRAMNERDGPVTREAFAAAVSDAAGRDRTDWVDRYVTTSAVPDVPAFLGGGAVGGPLPFGVTRRTGAFVALLVGGAALAGALAVGRR